MSTSKISPASHSFFILNICIHWKLYFQPVKYFYHIFYFYDLSVYLSILWIYLSICIFTYCAQSCLILCGPMHCDPPGSSVHGLFQARILEWVAISYPGALPDFMIKWGSLLSPASEGRFLHVPPRKPRIYFLHIIHKSFKKTSILSFHHQICKISLFSPFLCSIGETFILLSSLYELHPTHSIDLVTSFCC